MNDVRDAFRFIADNPSLLLEGALNQLAIAAVALVIALVIALPIGVWLGHRHRGSFVAINIANVGRALPSLAVIAMLIAVVGIGTVPLVIALVILAAPPVLTNAYVAVDGVDRDVVDAARGMGMREREVLLGVELPNALPLIIGG
ncbi:MAG: binding-protein-dependent transport system inner rane component, partial [Solirubrobacterales bacterium]|nr:binding-protein-dependent transport system inner rane component [Solirubrobacterales bacterium]